MVDEQRVLRMLRRIADDVGTLHALGSVDPREPVRLGAIKYAFITAIEGCIRVAQHLGASERWRPPDSNGDAFTVLGEHGVVQVELAEQLARAVGFRNVLVHQYADVDDDRVIAMLDRVGDLEAFVSQTSAWVAAQR